MKKDPNCVTRREFLQKASATAAASALTAGSAAPMVVPASVFGAAAPSNRITVACIGTGNQGFGILGKFLKQPGSQVVAVCDVNRGSFGYKNDKQFCGRQPARKLVNDHYAAAAPSGQYKGCNAYSDFREVLARKDIDAVAVVTPDHWHSLMTVMACQAGKDIYCEKPLSLTVADGREMVQAVRKHKRILQTGSHERSNPRTRMVCELVRNGRIGQLRKVTVFVGYHNKVGPGPGWRAMPVPEGFDYRTWLGPAPEAPYHKDRCLYRFRFIYDYSGGQITNFGAHSIDMAQWAMGTDDTGPTEVELLDAKFLPKGSLFDAATETKFRCRYANGVEMVCDMDKSSVGARFEGTEGMIQTGYGGLKANPESLKTAALGPDDKPLYRSDDHVGNFLESVRTRREPVAPVEVGHRSATICHLGTIAVRLGKKKILQWDPAREQFGNDDDANAMLSRPRRGQWAK